MDWKHEQYFELSIPRRLESGTLMARENVEEPEEYRRSASLTLMQCGSTKGGVRLARGWLTRYPRSDMRLR